MNQWIDPAERERLKKKEEEERKEKEANKRKKMLTLDFAGRQVVVGDSAAFDFDNLSKEITKVS